MLMNGHGSEFRITGHHSLSSQSTAMICKLVRGYLKVGATAEISATQGYHVQMYLQLLKNAVSHNSAYFYSMMRK